MHGQTIDSMTASKYKMLLIEYIDMFEVPRKPVARVVDHRIDLTLTKVGSDWVLVHMGSSFSNL